MDYDIPKQYIEVGGKPIISYCLETFFSHDGIDLIHITADEAWHGFIEKTIGRMQGVDRKKICGFSEPGANRQLSILNGLKDIRHCADPDDLVIIHDAVRPFVSGKLITELLETIDGHEGVMPALPMADTVYLSDNGGNSLSLLDRGQIFAGQAPEIFRLESYYKANIALLPDAIFRIKGSTEPAIMAGLDVIMIPGDEGNFKITTMNDLERFQNIIKNGMNFESQIFV